MKEEEEEKKKNRRMGTKIFLVWHDTAGNYMLTLLPELISVAIDILLVYVDFILFL